MLRDESLLFGVAQHGGRLDVDTVLTGARQDGARQPWLQIFGTVAEIGLGGADMRGVGHGIFVAFWKPVDVVGQYFALIMCQSVSHFFIVLVDKKSWRGIKASSINQHSSPAIGSPGATAPRQQDSASCACRSAASDNIVSVCSVFQVVKLGTQRHEAPIYVLICAVDRGRFG